MNYPIRKNHHLSWEGGGLATLCDASEDNEIWHVRREMLDKHFGELMSKKADRKAVKKELYIYTIIKQCDRIIFEK